MKVKFVITYVLVCLLMMEGNARKFSKSHQKDQQNKAKTASTSAGTTTVNPSDTPIATTTTSTQDKKQTKQAQPTQKQKNQTLKAKEQEKPQEKPKQKTQQKPNKQKTKQQPQNQFKVIQYKMQPSKNQYVIPIQLKQYKYNLAIGYDEKSSQYGNFPSWIFTTLTQQHQLCDANDDCDDIQHIVKCSKQKQSLCVDKGKGKYSSELIQSKKKVNVTFTNNNNTVSYLMASPSKITLKNNKMGQNQIQGFLNLALNPNQKYTNGIIVNGNIIKLTEQKQIQSKLKEKNVLDLSKTGLLSLTNNKDIYIRTENVNDKKVINNVKQSYKQVKVGFNKLEKTMALPKTMVIVIKNLLKKQYFGDGCKIKDQHVRCTEPPVKKTQVLNLCRDEKGKQCIEMKILGAIVKQVKKDQSYKLLIEENKGQQDNTTIVLYPAFANYYQIYAAKGLVKGILCLDKSPQQISTTKDSQDSQQSQDQQSEKDKAKQQTKTEQKKQQKKVQQKKQQKKKKDEDKDEDQDQDQDQDETQQKQKQKKVKSLKKNAKNKNKQKHTQSKKVDQDKKKEQKGQIEQEKKQSKIILFFVFIYGSIFVGIIVIIKWKAQQTMAAALIDRFIQVTWGAIGKNFFNKNRGYNAAFQDEQRAQEQIDHSDSIAVGYNQTKGKQLFWENNSVEGI